MRLDRAATLSVFRPLQCAGVLRTKSGTPILMYHSISDDLEPGVSPYHRLTTSPARFREQMGWLRDAGYSVIDLAEALRRLEAGRPNPQPCAVLTFDDGFRDFMSHAWPTIEEFGFTATMFLPTGFIGNIRKCFKGRECLTWPEIRELHHRGISFGAHTINHPDLYRLPWPDIRRELRDSRLQIESELRAPVSTFAYPYAFPQEDRGFVTRFRHEIASEGYSVAVTTIIGRAHPGTGTLCLPRLPVNESDDERLFISKLAGAYDWVGGLQLLSRSAKKRSTALKAAWHARHRSPVT